MRCASDAPIEYVWSRVRTRGTAPPPGCCHSLVCYRDRYLVLFGGGSSEGATNAVHVFDVCTHTWTRVATQHAELVAPRIGHTAVLHRDRMIVYGGQDVDESVPYDDVLALDLRTWTWSVLQAHAPSEPAGPGHRRLHTAHVVGDRMYVFMGEPCHTSTMCWYLDLRSLAWHALPFDTVAVDARGGNNNNNCSTSARVRHFGRPVLPLVGHSSVVDGAYAYVVCGYRTLVASDARHSNNNNNNNSSNSSSYYASYSDGVGRPVSYSSAVYCYHFASNRWAELRVVGSADGNRASMPAPRYASAVAAHRGTLYLYGGDTNHNAAATYYDDFWSLTLRPASHDDDDDNDDTQCDATAQRATRPPVDAASSPTLQWTEQRCSRAARGRWRRDAADYPCARSGASCAVARGALYLVGGELPSKAGGDDDDDDDEVAALSSMSMTRATSATPRDHTRHGGRNNDTVDYAPMYDAAMYRCPLSLSLSLSLRDNACRFLAQNNRGLVYAASEAAMLPSCGARRLLCQYVPSARCTDDAVSSDSGDDDDDSDRHARDGANVRVVVDGDDEADGDARDGYTVTRR